jgi:hypothetical protein
VKGSEIIAAMRQAASEAEAEPYGESEVVTAYKRYIAAKLEHVVGQMEPEMHIPSCADFAYLQVECCPICHDDCSNEMEIIEIESGGRAWLCCSLDRAVNPNKRAAMEDSPEWQDLIRLFSSLSDPSG